MSPSVWLDRHRAVEQMTWAPGEPQTILGRLASEGGWIDRPGVATFNLYRPPVRAAGQLPPSGALDRAGAADLPDNAGHIIAFCAHRVQFPAVKINHGLVLTGSPGIGKDTILEPLKLGVGPWNFKEVSPPDITTPYNDYMRGVVLRISEARDLGEINRYAFYESTKTLMAAPPDVTRVNTKYIRAILFGECDRRDPHDELSAGRALPAARRPAALRRRDGGHEGRLRGRLLAELWDWYRSGGLEDVVAYLAQYDLSKFDPKTPPEKTEAFWRMVDGGMAPEVPSWRRPRPGRGRAGCERQAVPPAAVTMLAMVMDAAARGETCTNG